MANSRPAHDELRAGYCRKQATYCSSRLRLVAGLPRRSGASTFLGISVSAFSFRKPLENSTAQLLNFSSESSSALDQVNDYDDDSNYEEEMD